MQKTMAACCFSDYSIAHSIFLKYFNPLCVIFNCKGLNVYVLYLAYVNLSNTLLLHTLISILIYIPQNKQLTSPMCFRSINSLHLWLVFAA